MGLERLIQFPTEPPSWATIRAQLASVREAPTIRMIDGLPAFPDEVPEPDWKELRVGFAAGMISLRRAGDTLACIVWGNADVALRLAWDRLTWACASSGGGHVQTPTGPLSADEFGREAGIVAA
jgi:hypothetical protein